MDYVAVFILIAILIAMMIFHQKEIIDCNNFYIEQLDRCILFDNSTDDDILRIPINITESFIYDEFR